MNKVYFLMAIHNHQPVGNFDHVIEDSYKKSYLPFLEVLERHPKIKVGFDCSGILYDWFENHHPEYFNLISRLIRNNQLELLTGGYYEPILSMIPDRDKVEQIKLFTDYIRRKFAVAPKGAWLTERVWEPGFVPFLTKAKVSYTMVDEYHFNAAGISSEELSGYYITEDNNETLSIFPINKKLRYAVPFTPVKDVISIFREVAEREKDVILVLGDDGEKFGSWPGTFHSVYEEGWLEEFFSELENNYNWLEMAHFSEVLENFSPKGRVYLPSSSYSEMMEWSLPAEEAYNYKKFLKSIKNSKELESGQKFVRSGFWRNFLIKYPESNQMQKKASFVSSKIPGTSSSIIKKELFMGECNCPYWHGVFGGLYLPHLRSANYEHLIKAEYMADLKRIKNKKQWLKRRILDFDCDGHNEILLENSKINLYISPAYGASIFELDLKGEKYFNLINTISRKVESYHFQVKELENVDETEVTSIHDKIKSKETGLDKYLQYDWYLRRSLLDHICALDTTVENFKNSEYWELGDFIMEPYKFEVKKGKNYYRVQLRRLGNLWLTDRKIPWQITKIIDFFSDSRNIIVKYEITNLSSSAFKFIFGSEFNFSLLTGASPGKYIYSGNDLNRIAGLSQTGNLNSLNHFGILDNDLGIQIDFNLKEQMNLWYFPIETVSQSEAGFERVYQETCFLINKQIDLQAGETVIINFDFNLKIF